MTKDSTIGRTVADRLISSVDRIRGRVHARLGTRQWRVAIVTRRWSGEERGVGHPTISVLELEPPPNVKLNTKDRLGPAGREASGSIILTEVSLSYTEAELEPKVDARTEVAYRLTENQGQRQRVIWGVLSAKPITRRGDQSGDATDWYLTLNETTSLGEQDGVDAP